VSVCVRRDVWQTIEGDKPRSYYLDLRRYRAFLIDRCQTPFTPAVNTMMALNAALDELLEVGLVGRREHYKHLNDRIRRGLLSLGMEIMVDEERSSHSITVVKVPDGMTYQDIYLGLKDRGFIVYESKGALSGGYFQVANMGALEEIHIDEFLAAMGQVLSEARHGSLVTAAAGALRLV
jgi:2-aminoethylphosphonate-pyruvate transaminase